MHTLSKENANIPHQYHGRTPLASSITVSVAGNGNTELNCGEITVFPLNVHDQDDEYGICGVTYVSKFDCAEESLVLWIHAGCLMKVAHESKDIDHVSFGF